MSKLSNEFHVILSSESKTIDFAEYEQCSSELTRMYGRASKSETILAILFFCVGLWAVYEQAMIVAVLFLALAMTFDRSATLAVVQSNRVTAHRLLAMVINKQSQSIESLRLEIKDLKFRPNGN